MQTTKVVENSGNVPENVPPMQVEWYIRNSSFYGNYSWTIHSWGTTFDENAPTVSEKIIDEIFSSIITLPEGHQQIKPSANKNCNLL